MFLQIILVALYSFLFQPALYCPHCRSPNIPFHLDSDGFPIDFIFTFMTFKTSAPIITVLSFFCSFTNCPHFNAIQDTMHIKSQNVKIWQNPCKHNIFDIILIPGFSILTDWAGVLRHYSVMQKTALIFFSSFFLILFSLPKLVFCEFEFNLLFEYGVYLLEEMLLLKCLRIFYFLWNPFYKSGPNFSNIEPIQMSHLYDKALIHLYRHSFE